MTSARDATAIRPFHVSFPDSDLQDLRRRIQATRLPERETVTDFSQGVPLATVQKLARYWGTEYDWRKVEARLNAVPHFITELDGLDIHFIHVRSKHENALPLIVTHGWSGYQAPRSWVEQAYPRLIHYNKLPKGGHFAAWEQPKYLCEEIRAGLKSLRS